VKMKHLQASSSRLVVLLFASSNSALAAFSTIGTPPSISTKTTRPISLANDDDIGFSSTKLQASSQLSENINDGKEDGYDIAELMSSEMEQARLSNQYARYSHDDWLRHRASDRFFNNLFKFDKSPIVKNLLDEAAILAAICVGIIPWNELLIEGWTDLNEVHHEAPLANILPAALTFKLALPTEPFFLCGGPLGLLLVFRNDCSFGRYKDAFHHWEVACSSLGNMILMAASSGTSNVEGVKQLSVASWAVVRTLQHEVSGGFDTTYDEDLKKNIPDEKQVQLLLSARNKLHRSHYDVHRAVVHFPTIYPTWTNGPS